MLVSKSKSDNRVLVTRLEGTFLNTGFNTTSEFYPKSRCGVNLKTTPWNKVWFRIRNTDFKPYCRGLYFPKNYILKLFYFPLSKENIFSSKRMRSLEFQ